MPERFLESGIEQDVISFVSPQDILRMLEGADGYLPFATEVSSRSRGEPYRHVQRADGCGRG